MRFHFGVSFRPKNFAKWGMLIVGGLLAFFSFSKVHALTGFSPNTVNVSGNYAQSYYACNNSTDVCYYLTDSQTGLTNRDIPWTSPSIEGQDYSGVDSYTVEAIRIYGVNLYNNSSASGTIPANSVVTVKFQFQNLDKFTKGSNFNNPSVAVRNTSNSWTYGTYNQSFVCNRNSCTLTYVTPSSATKGLWVFWNVNSTDYDNFFVRNDTSQNYSLVLQSVSVQYDNSTEAVANAINQQTQVISSWSSTINDSIISTQNLVRNVVSSQNTTNNLIQDSSVDDKSSFFTNFSDNSHGLSGIVSAPLVLVRGLNSGTSCDPLTFSVFGKSVSMPSGCILWNQVPTEVETIYFVFIGGFLAYILVTKLFHDINDLKDPEKSEVSTLDL